jgi:hypothetical protein
MRHTRTTRETERIIESKRMALAEESIRAEEALRECSPNKTSELIAHRAYHLWLQRGCTHGHDINDWLEAEKELAQECIS